MLLAGAEIGRQVVHPLENANTSDQKFEKHFGVDNQRVAGIDGSW